MNGRDKRKKQARRAEKARMRVNQPISTTKSRTVALLSGVLLTFELRTLQRDDKDLFGLWVSREPVLPIHVHGLRRIMNNLGPEWGASKNTLMLVGSEIQIQSHEVLEDDDERRI